MKNCLTQQKWCQGPGSIPRLFLDEAMCLRGWIVSVEYTLEARWGPRRIHSVAVYTKEAWKTGIRRSAPQWGWWFQDTENTERDRKLQVRRLTPSVQLGRQTAELVYTFAIWGGSEMNFTSIFIMREGAFLAVRDRSGSTLHFFSLTHLPPTWGISLCESKHLSVFWFLAHLPLPTTWRLTGTPNLNRETRQATYCKAPPVDFSRGRDWRARIC